MNAITSYKTYGLTRSQVASMCINLFHYPDMYKDTLEEYYILHWTSEHFQRTVKHGIISRVASTKVAITGSEDCACNKVDYLVVYQGCTPYQVARAKELRLSFRKAKQDFGMCAYVIVRISPDPSIIDTAITY